MTLSADTVRRMRSSLDILVDNGANSFARIQAAADLLKAVKAAARIIDEDEHAKAKERLRRQMEKALPRGGGVA